MKKNEQNTNGCKPSGNYVFVYCLWGEYKCLGLNDGIDNHKTLIAQGWALTATIDPAVWLESFINGGEDERTEALFEIS